MRSNTPPRNLYIVAFCSCARCLSFRNGFSLGAFYILSNPGMPYLVSLEFAFFGARCEFSKRDRNKSSKLGFQREVCKRVSTPRPSNLHISFSCRF